MQIILITDCKQQLHRRAENYMDQVSLYFWRKQRNEYKKERINLHYKIKTRIKNRQNNISIKLIEEKRVI